MELVAVRPRVLLVKSELQDDGQVCVTVEDSGSGIIPDDLDRLFNSFFTTKAEGMGMGLSICRSIIESHGGHLWASPGATHGAVFRFDLPAGAP
jgi:signal transduction histidine kinase